MRETRVLDLIACSKALFHVDTGLPPESDELYILYFFVGAKFVQQTLASAGLCGSPEACTRTAEQLRLLSWTRFWSRSCSAADHCCSPQF